MKKNRLKLSLFCLLILCLVCLPTIKPLLKTENANGTYCFYTSIKQECIEGAKVISLGSGSMVLCSASKSSLVKKQLNNIIGESVSFTGSLQDIFNIFKQQNADIVKCENVDGIELFYGFSSTIQNYCLVNNKKVNLQIAFNNGMVTVGTPLILGSY